MSRRLFLLAILALAGCARGSAPLPGDSVSSDGAVTLSPPRMSTAPASALERVEPLGALESRLFPAELVMDHQTEIALTGPQRDAITRELDTSQSEFVRIQWQLQAEKEKLVAVLDAPKVDEAKAKETAARVMIHENEIKAAHLALLVRIKNQLTPAQQDLLRAARDAERCGAARP
jgi:Spy/CpxP family protein refolding chaperone